NARRSAFFGGGLGLGFGLFGSSTRASAAASSGTDPYLHAAVVSTLAGSGTPGADDLTGTAAAFEPMGGIVVVGNAALGGSFGTMRKTDLTTHAVTTLAGSASARGCADTSSPGSERFGQIADLATDGTYLYATHPDCSTGFTYLIRKVMIATGA